MSKEFNDFDDLDFDDDFYLEDGIKPSGGDRTPIVGALSDGFTGISESMGMMDSQEEITKLSGKLTSKIMGKDLSDASARTKDTFEEELDIAAKELKRTARPIATAFKRIAPKDGLLGDMSNKFISFFDEESKSDSLSEDEILNNKVSSALQNLSLFNTDEKIRQEDLLKETVRFKQITDQIKLAQSTANSSSSMENFHNRFTNEFYKKQLELQYRQVFLSKDIKGILSIGFDRLHKEQNIIAKNTALPDFVKMKSSEAIQAQVRNKLYGNMTDKLFTQSTWLDNLQTNIRSRAKNTLSNVSETLDNASGIAEIYNDTSSQVEDLGEMGETKAGMAGGLAFDAGKGFLTDKLTSKLAESKYFNKIFKSAQEANTSMPEWLAGIEENKKGSLTGNIAGYFKNLMRDPSQFTNTAIGEDDLNDNVLFDKRAHVSIVKVIPGLLSKILKEVSSTRTGKNEEELLYNYNKDLFESKSEFVSSFKGQLKRDLYKSGTSKQIESFISNLLKNNQDIKFNKKEHDILIKSVFDYSASNKPLYPVYLEKHGFYETFPEEMTERVKQLFDSSLQNTDGSVDVDNAKSMGSDLRMIRGSLDNPRSKILDYKDSGKTQQLLDMGILDYNKITDEYDINMEKYYSIAGEVLPDAVSEDFVRSMENKYDTNDVNSGDSVGLSDIFKSGVDSVKNLDIEKAKNKLVSVKNSVVNRLKDLDEKVSKMTLETFEAYGINTKEQAIKYITDSYGEHIPEETRKSIEDNLNKLYDSKGYTFTEDKVKKSFDYIKDTDKNKLFKDLGKLKKHTLFKTNKIIKSIKSTNIKDLKESGLTTKDKALQYIIETNDKLDIKTINRIKDELTTLYNSEEFQTGKDNLTDVFSKENIDKKIKDTKAEVKGRYDHIKKSIDTLKLSDYKALGFDTANDALRHIKDQNPDLTNKELKTLYKQLSKIYNVKQKTSNLSETTKDRLWKSKEEQTTEDGETIAEVVGENLEKTTNTILDSIKNAFPKKKEVNFDSDNDGDRDNSWMDRLAFWKKKPKKDEPEVINKKDVDKKGGFGSLMIAAVVGGFGLVKKLIGAVGSGFGGLLTVGGATLSILGGLGGLLGGGGSLVSGLFKSAMFLPKMLSKALWAGVTGVPKVLTFAGSVAKALLNPAETLKKAGGTIAKAVTATAAKVGIGTAAAKVGTKAAVKTATTKAGAKAAAKIGTKLGIKTGAKMAAKAVPGLGLLAGIGFALDRFSDGDVSGGALEILSGLLSSFPGIGTVSSLGISGYLLSEDLKKAGDVKPGELSGDLKEAVEWTDVSKYSEDFQKTIRGMDLEIARYNVKIDNEASGQRKKIYASKIAKIVEKREQVIAKADEEFNNVTATNDKLKTKQKVIEDKSKARLEKKRKAMYDANVTYGKALVELKGATTDSEKAKLTKKVELARKDKDEKIAKFQGAINGTDTSDVKTPATVTAVKEGKPVVGEPNSSVVTVTPEKETDKKDKVKNNVLTIPSNIKSDTLSDSGVLTGIAKTIGFIIRTVETRNKYNTATIVKGESWVSFGAYQFTESSGNLKKVLKLMSSMSPSYKVQLDVILSKMTNKGTYKGSKTDLKTFLRQIGNDPVSKKAQDVLFYKDFYKPAEKSFKSSGKYSNNLVLMHFVDHGVNAGPGSLKSLIKNASQDTMQSVVDARFMDYKTKKKWSMYAKGWTNRVNEVSKLATKYIKGEIGDGGLNEDIDAISDENLRTSDIGSTESESSGPMGTIKNIIEGIFEFFGVKTDSMLSGSSKSETNKQRGANEVVNDASGNQLKTFVNATLGAVGNPYKWGEASLETGADCSGLVVAALKRAGYPIGRTNAAGLLSGRQGTLITSLKETKVGDSLFFRKKKTGKIHHVGTITSFSASGIPMMTHAKGKKYGTLTEELSKYYQGEFAGAKRWFTTSSVVGKSIETDTVSADKGLDLTDKKSLVADGAIMSVPKDNRLVGAKKTGTSIGGAFDNFKSVFGGNKIPTINSAEMLSKLNNKSLKDIDSIDGKSITDSELFKDISKTTKSIPNVMSQMSNTFNVRTPVTQTESKTVTPMPVQITDEYSKDRLTALTDIDKTLKETLTVQKETLKVLTINFGSKSMGVKESNVSKTQDRGTIQYKEPMIDITRKTVKK